MNVPEIIKAGLSYNWTDTDEDYAAATYTAKCAVKLIGSSVVVTITASGSGYSYTFTISASVSAALTPGKYEWQEYVESVLGVPAVTAAADTGTLTAATYYYRVSAVNAVGETLACVQVPCVLASQGGVKLTWTAIAGATSYKVYGRTTGAQLLIATVTGAVTYTDSGAITPAGALPTADTTLVRYELGRGNLIVMRFLGTSGTVDSRSNAQATLDAINAVILGRASKDQEEFQIAGRMLKRTPVPELLILKEAARAEVAREDKENAIINGETPKGKILVRFK